jgi:hypothetical protein
MPKTNGNLPTQQTCATCSFATFEMTKHTPPRIKPNVTGRCEWPVPVAPLIAICIMDKERADAVFSHKGGIWPDLSGCPVWQAKKETP